MGPSHVMICKWNASWKVLSRDVHSFNTSLWWELNSLIWPGRRKYFYYHKKTNCHIAKSHIYSTCYSVILRSLRVFSTKVLLAIVKIPIPDYFQTYKCKTIQKQNTVPPLHKSTNSCCPLFMRKFRDSSFHFSKQ